MSSVETWLLWRMSKTDNDDLLKKKDWQKATILTQKVKNKNDKT